MTTVNAMDKRITEAQKRLNSIFSIKTLTSKKLEKAKLTVKRQTLKENDIEKVLFPIQAELRAIDKEYKKRHFVLKNFKAEKVAMNKKKPDTVLGFFKETVCSIVPNNVRRKRNLGEQKAFNAMVRITKIKIEEQCEVDRKKLHIDIREIMGVMNYTLDQAIFLKKRELIQKEEHNAEIAFNYYNKAETDSEIFKGIAKNRRNLLIMGAVFGAVGTVVSMGLESLIEEASLDAVAANASRHLEVLAEIESRDPYWFNMYGHGMVMLDTFKEDMANSTLDTAAGTPAYVIQSDAYQYTTTALSAASIVAPLSGAAVFDKLAKEGSPFDKTDKQTVKESKDDKKSESANPFR